MIIRNLYGDDDDENVYIFEALGNKGVRITDWDACRDKLGAGKYFKKIAYRHTVFERNQESSDNLLRFISEA